MAASDRPGRAVKATERSLQLVETVRELGGATLTELSERSELAKSTVINHVNTLERSGFLVRDGNVYHIGLKFLHMGEYARNRNELYRVSERHVHELAAETGEEVNISIEEHGWVIPLHHILGKPNETWSKGGKYLHMHNTSSGKAILAELSDDRVDRIIERRGLPATTEQTITNREELFEELERTRDRGYAINNDELLEGFCSISVAVNDPEEGVMGALCVGGARYRLRHDGVINLIRSTAKDIEEDLADPSLVLPIQ